jgi:hypothetical protein
LRQRLSDQLVLLRQTVHEVLSDQFHLQCPLGRLDQSVRLKGRSVLLLLLRQLRLRLLRQSRLVDL